MFLGLLGALLRGQMLEPAVRRASAAAAYVVARRGCAFAEKVLFHLLDDRGLVLAAGGIEPVFVQQHLAEFRPPLPGLERDVIVDFLTQLRIERRLIQAG